MKNWVGLFLCAVAISMWVGCGGGSGGGGTTPPGISVAFSTAPPASLQVVASAQVAATVTNDSSTNGGVDWSCTPASTCGTFNPTHTASAAATTYTAPSAVPAGNSVTITATSTASSTASVSGKTTITVPGITFSPAAPASLDVNQSGSLTAVVTSDSAKAGVDWSCSPINVCGTFNPKHTASGVATAYTAPAGAVTARIKATSTADASVSAIANIKILGVAIAFYPQPTPSLLTNDTNAAPISVSVSHDVTSSGATWACSGDCGTLGPSQTVGCSLCSNTYTTASTPGQATITVTSIADPTQMVSAIITQSTSFGNSTIGMQGGDNYVFQTAGIDAHGAYQLTGVFTADGAGNITDGEQHYSNTLNVYIDSISSGSYTIGADGRGTITLNTGDTNIGQNGTGTEILGLVVIDGTKGLITQFDDSATSSGTLDLQTPKSQLSGGYAFVTSGVNLAVPPKPLGFGGVINIDGPDTISGKGSVADAIDNTTHTPGATLSGTVANPDPLGKIVFNLTTSFTHQNVALVGYTIDDTRVRLIENDTYGSTAGTAYGQGASTGTFSSSNFPSQVVFETEGLSGTGAPYAPTVYAGLFAASSGTIGGVVDENVSGGTPIVNGTLAGNYAVDSSGTGRVTTTGVTINSNPGPTWVFYLTGDASVPALVLQVDAAPIETAGALFTQTGSPFSVSAFTGLYATNFTAFPAATTEDDGTGQVKADGISALGSPGNVDVNYDAAVGGQQTGQTLVGSFAANSNGRFTGAVTAGTGGDEIFNSAQMAFYIVDGTHVVFIENDAQPAVGVLRLQEQ
jgi:hypothetical protein